MKINQSLIRQARQSDLKTFLETKGYEFIRNGKSYRCKEHSSLIITNNMFFWNSKSLSGNAIDFLVNCLNYTFKDALEALTNTDLSIQKQKNFQKLPTSKSSKNYSITKNNINRAYAYLSKKRLINNSIITQLVESNHLKMIESTKYKHTNIAFTIFDEFDNVLGYELQGTLDKVKFKGITEDTQYGYGFNLRTSNKPNRAFFFESAVDLISFYQLYKTHLEDSILISMAGLKINILKHTLEAFKIVSKPFICTDNDVASINFKKALTDSDISFKDVLIPNNQCKDWNEFLKIKNQESKDIKEDA